MGHPAVLKLELLEQWPVELKRPEGILVRLGMEAPQCAQLLGTSPLEDYHQPARPRPIPKGEDGKLETWPAINQWKGWPHSRDDAPNEA